MLYLNYKNNIRDEVFILTEQEILSATIELSKVFVKDDCKLYREERDKIEDLLIYLSEAITNVERKGYFKPNTK